MLALLAALLLGGLMPLVPKAGAADGAPVWTNLYNGPSNNFDLAQAIAVDSAGNVVVTGATASSGDDFDYVTVKYLADGTPLWTNYFIGQVGGWDVASAIAVDSADNVFVTGYSVGSYTGNDYATIKYLADGTPVWTNRYNTAWTNFASVTINGDDGARAITVDSAGNVFVTGYSSSTNNTYLYDYATIKYRADGTPLWTNRYNGPDDSGDGANSIAVDSAGNAFVAGISKGDYVTIKYLADGTPAWTNRYNGPGNGDDTANALAVDSAGNVFVTGESIGSGTAGSDYATIKYLADGTPAWTNRYSGQTNGGDLARALAVDSAGNVVVTGYSDRGDGTSNNYVTIKYLANGTPAWTNLYNGPGNGYDNAYALAVDRAGNVFVTGESIGGNSYVDCATIKYLADGTPVWTNIYNSPANFNDGARAIAADSAGNVFVAGFTISTNGYPDYVTLKYSAPTSPPVPVALPGGDGSLFRFRFDTLLGKLYTVEYKDSLSDTNWQAQQSLPGVHAAQTVTNLPPPPPGVTTRFFRVKEE
ncbi:MAG: SBBP repeat-containing protein [Verrucomicrobia bacterium]|nr:SBBP repeat-containing protein [Verrucomicrobiota bacterium]